MISEFRELPGETNPDLQQLIVVMSMFPSALVSLRRNLEAMGEYVRVRDDPWEVCRLSGLLVPIDDGAQIRVNCGASIRGRGKVKDWASLEQKGQSCTIRMKHGPEENSLFVSVTENFQFRAHRFVGNVDEWRGEYTYTQRLMDLMEWWWFISLT